MHMSVGVRDNDREVTEYGSPFLPGKGDEN